MCYFTHLLHTSECQTQHPETLGGFAALPGALWICKPRNGLWGYRNAVFQSTAYTTAIYCKYIVQSLWCLAERSWYGKDQKCWWTGKYLGTAVNFFLLKSSSFWLTVWEPVFTVSQNRLLFHRVSFIWKGFFFSADFAGQGSEFLFLRLLILQT